jgi:CRISPR type III-A-associated protein Csm2
MSSHHRGNNTHGGGRSRGSTASPPVKIEFELMDADGKIPMELYDETAQKISRQLVQGRMVSRHQLRKLYDEVKRIKRRLDNQQTRDADKAWEAALPEIKLMKSKVAYVSARNTKRDEQACYGALKDFLVRGIDKSTGPEEFNVFVTLFEAVYGFYYELGGNKQQ